MIKGHWDLPKLLLSFCITQEFIRLLKQNFIQTSKRRQWWYFFPKVSFTLNIITFSVSCSRAYLRNERAVCNHISHLVIYSIGDMNHWFHLLWNRAACVSWVKHLPWIVNVYKTFYDIWCWRKFHFGSPLHSTSLKTFDKDVKFTFFEAPCPVMATTLYSFKISLSACWYLCMNNSTGPETDFFPLFRYEHSSRGGGGSSLWLACPGSLPHHQQGCDRLWQQWEGKPWGGVEDHPVSNSGPPETCWPTDHQDLAPSSETCNKKKNHLIQWWLLIALNE